MNKICDELKHYSRQFFAVFTATLVSASHGMELGWPSPAIPKLRNPTSGIPVSYEESYWIEVTYILGATLMTPVTFWLLKYCGRNKVITLSGVLALIAWILIATATNMYQIYAARFISGAGMLIGFVVVPMYTAEVTEPKFRGFGASLLYCMHRLGIILCYCIVPYIPIYLSSIVGAAMAFLQVITFPCRPESPYYHLQQSKKEEAKQSLARLRFKNCNLDEELQDMAANAQHQKSEKGRIKDLFLIPSNRKSILIMFVSFMTHAFCGIAVIVMNVQTILEKADNDFSPKFAAIFYSITQFVGSIVGLYLIYKFNRKILVVIASALITLSLGLLSAYFYIKDKSDVDVSSYSWIPLFTLIVYAFSFDCGMTNVVSALFSELLHINVKSLGMVLTELWYNILSVVVVKVYYATSLLYGMYVPFMIYSLLPAVYIFFVIFYVPETKGKSLEEIQRIMKAKTNRIENEASERHQSF